MPDLILHVDAFEVVTPLIWALQAEKAGDNAQVDTLLEAVGLPVTVKRLRMRRAGNGASPGSAPGWDTSTGRRAMRWSRPGRTWWCSAGGA